jgi:hypothetical protein
LGYNMLIRKINKNEESLNLRWYSIST